MINDRWGDDLDPMIDTNDHIDRLEQAIDAGQHPEERALLRGIYASIRHGHEPDLDHKRRLTHRVLQIASMAMDALDPEGRYGDADP